MLSVMIVDDEKWIGELITRSVPWQELELEVVCVAQNGLEALKNLETGGIDIVITDIRMPGMDGIQLIKTAYERGYAARFIIISGYQDFEYAKSAIQFRVTNYIVKPIEEEELMSSLLTVANEINFGNAERQKQEKIANRLNEITECAKQQFVSLTATGEGSAVNLQLKSQFSFNEVAYTCIVMKVDNTFWVTQETQVVNLILKQLIEFTDKLFNSQKVSFARGMLRSSILYVVNQKPDYSIMTLLQNAMIELKIILAAYPPHAITIGLGRRVSEINSVNESYAAASNAIKRRLIDGTGIIIDGRDLPENEQQAPLGSQIIQKLQYYITSMEITGLQSFLRSCFSNPNGAKAYADYPALARGIIMETWKYLAESGHRTNQNRNAVLNGIEDACTLPLLGEYVFRIIRDELQTFEQEKKDMLSFPVMRVKDFVANEYKRGISLTEAADVVNLNPNYLSKIFKSETGITFIEYLTQHRINAAKKLLTETTMKIADIPLEVGYCDAKYFAKTFRKLVGITPKEYRRLHHGRSEV